MLSRLARRGQPCKHLGRSERPAGPSWASKCAGKLPARGASRPDAAPVASEPGWYVLGAGENRPRGLVRPRGGGEQTAAPNPAECSRAGAATAPDRTQPGRPVRSRGGGPPPAAPGETESERRPPGAGGGDRGLRTRARRSEHPTLQTAGLQTQGFRFKFLPHPREGRGPGRFQGLGSGEPPCFPGEAADPAHSGTSRPPFRAGADGVRQEPIRALIWGRNLGAALGGARRPSGGDSTRNRPPREIGVP